MKRVACAECGKRFLRTTAEKTCSDACRLIRRKRDAKARCANLPRRQCAVCGKGFQPVTGQHTICGVAECRREAERRRRARSKDARKARNRVNQRRRYATDPEYRRKVRDQQRNRLERDPAAVKARNKANYLGHRTDRLAAAAARRAERRALDQQVQELIEALYADVWKGKR